MSTKNGIFIKCFNCGKRVYENQSSLKGRKNHFCSRNCFVFKVKVVCPLCKKEFFTKRAKWVSNKECYCSRSCSTSDKRNWFTRHPEVLERIRRASTGVEKKPETIKKWREKIVGQKRTPEQRMRIRESLPRGDKNPRWKGGITPINQLVRHSVEMRGWRTEVFSRDNFTCQDCGKRGGKLHAHHIKQFSLIFRENRIKTVSEALACNALWDSDNGKTMCEECHKKIPVVRWDIATSS